MYCSLPGSSVHGIFQARILEWVAIFFSRGSSLMKEAAAKLDFERAMVHRDRIKNLKDQTEGK